MKNIQTPKQRVKEAFKYTSGTELAKKLMQYWKLKKLLDVGIDKTPKQDSLIDMATDIFKVDGPSVSVN